MSIPIQLVVVLSAENIFRWFYYDPLIKVTGAETSFLCFYVDLIILFKNLANVYNHLLRGFE